MKVKRILSGFYDLMLSRDVRTKSLIKKMMSVLAKSHIKKSKYSSKGLPRMDQRKYSFFAKKRKTQV
jgi:hypothetical protein